jgi:2Fe-2S ferredoxin
MTIIVEDDHSGEQEYEAVDGWSLMEILKEYNLPLKAECGGACVCATCHVYIDKEWMSKLPQPSDDELDMLNTAPDVRENSRLSCQIIISSETDGLRLKIAKCA